MSAAHPNIRTRADEHRADCIVTTTTHQIDDVRRCRHGRTQHVTADPWGRWWEDLSPLLDPIRWARARRALRAATE